MPWAVPAWCTAPGRGAPRATLSIRDPQGNNRQHDISDTGFFLLRRETPETDEAGEQASSWHAAVLRDEQGTCYVMDLNSATGTAMNSIRLEPNKPCKWLP